MGTSSFGAYLFIKFSIIESRGHNTISFGMRPKFIETSTTPSCSGPLPTHRIQRHLVPGAVYSSSLHLCSLKECHIYVRPHPSTIFKVKSNNCKRIHTSALINGSCRMISVYRSTAINFSCLKKDFRLYVRCIENDVT